MYMVLIKINYGDVNFEVVGHLTKNLLLSSRWHKGRGYI